jgi:hypothetical protein
VEQRGVLGALAAGAGTIQAIHGMRLWIAHHGGALQQLHTRRIFLTLRVSLNHWFGKEEKGQKEQKLSFN